MSQPSIVIWLNGTLIDLGLSSSSTVTFNTNIIYDVIVDPNNPSRTYLISQSSILTTTPNNSYGPTWSNNFMFKWFAIYCSPSVTNISDVALSNTIANSVNNVVIIGRFTYLGYNCMTMGYGLVSYTVPDTITDIDVNPVFSFQQNNTLTTFNFAKPLTTVGGNERAFQNLRGSAYQSKITVNVYNCPGNNNSTLTSDFKRLLGNVNVNNGGCNVNYISTKAPPTIRYFPNINISDGRTSYTLIPPYSDSNGTFSYSVINGNSVASVSSSTLTILSAGTATIRATQDETLYYASGTIDTTLTVQYPSPTITLTIPSKVYNETFSVDASSNSTGNLRYTSGNTSVVDVSGNTVTTVGVGNAIIRVDQEASGFFSSGNLTVSFTVSKGTPFISISSNVSVQYGTTYQYFPTSTNTQTSFSYASGNTSVATINPSSGNVNPVAIGTSVITVSQSGNGNWNAGSATSTVQVIKGTPIITFNNISTTFGSTVKLQPSSTNANGTFSYNSGNPSIATITDSSANIVGVGNTTITVTQASTSLYNSNTATATLTVSKANPTLTFNNISTTFGSTVKLQPSSTNSNGNISYNSGNTSIATITDSSANMVGAGNATITATQAETSNFNSGSATFTVNVAKANPVFSNFNIPAKTFGDADFTVSQPTSTNPDGTFSYASGNTSVATINGNTVTVVGAGNSLITATQAETNNYLTNNISTTFVVAKATPSLTDFTITSKTFGNYTFTLTPPSSTNAVGSFSYMSGNASVATIVGNVVTIRGAGQTIVTATQATTANFNSNNVVTTLTVSKATPAITFNNMSKTFGDQAFTLNASSASTGTFNYVSGNTSVATISGNTVTIVGAGSVDITATQDSDANYNQGTAIATLTIAKATPSITFSDMSKTYGDYFTISRPQTSSTGSVVYESLDTNIATINNNVVSVVGVGSTTIRATLSSDNNYNSRIVTATLTSVKATPTITFSAINKSYGSSAFTAPISTNSSGSIQYTSSNTGVATVGLTTGLITVLTVGNTTITAIQSADSNYNARTVTSVLTVSKANPSMGNFPNIRKKIGNVPFELTAPSTNSTGAISYESSNPRVATILNNIVTIIGPGTAIITAVQNATTNYNQGVITAFLIVDDVDRIVPNSPTPPNVADPLIRTSSRRPTARVSRKLAMRSKNLPGSVQYYH
jgi:hypothetical protein